MEFKKISDHFVFKSSNPLDPRISTHLTDSFDESQVHIWGYPDDEGIHLNGGRLGAAQGPDEIRKAFYKMTPGRLRDFKIMDRGDINMTKKLEDRHDLALQAVKHSLASKKFVLTLGGGHDYGYPDAKGFVETFKKSKKKPVVLNFDAHLDVRPLHQGLTSGTPFYRLLDEHASNLHFFEIGIQEHCNSAEHIQWCKSKKGKILFQNQIEKQGLESSLKKSLTGLKGHPAYISIDIDGFSSDTAPGCSQSWPTGFQADDFFKTLDFVFKYLDVKSLGVYEVSPPLDVQPLTSRLAALILYRSLLAKGF